MGQTTKKTQETAQREREIRRRASAADQQACTEISREPPGAHQDTSTPRRKCFPPITDGGHLAFALPVHGACTCGIQEAHVLEFTPNQALRSTVFSRSCVNKRTWDKICLNMHCATA